MFVGARPSANKMKTWVGKNDKFFFYDKVQLMFFYIGWVPCWFPASRVWEHHGKGTMGGRGVA